MRGQLAAAVWADAGRPRVGKLALVPGRCGWCGASSSSLLDGVCDPCAWAELGKPPDSFRLWSTLWREDWDAPASNPKVSPKLLSPRLHLFTRGTPEHARACLLSPPDCRWGMAVTTSGQVHTLGLAPINHGAQQWVVAVERELVTCTPRLFSEVMTAALELRKLKFTCDEIEACDWPMNKVAKQLHAWRVQERKIARLCGSPLLGLACFLSKEPSND